jgi:hypothetical protein
MAASELSALTCWLGQAQTLPIGIEPLPRPRRPSTVSTSMPTFNNTALVTTRPPNLIGAR